MTAGGVQSAITVVIPTYKRPAFVARAMDYWSASGWPVVIADGSTQPFGGEIPFRVTYVHAPGSSITDRIACVLTSVSTEFVVLCADDDFIGFNGIRACVQFLRDHPDHVAAQGDSFRFSQQTSPRILEIPPVTPSRDKRAVEGVTAIARLQQAMKPYVPLYYAVYRLDVARATFVSIAGVARPDSFIEWQAAMVPSILGKHVRLPLFYAAREEAVRREGPYASEDAESWLASAANASDIRLWRDYTARVYANAEGTTIASGRAAFDRALAAYMEFFAANRAPSVARAKERGLLTLRDMLPEWLLGLRRRLLYAVGLRSSRFPWTDGNAVEDWARMQSVILRHGVLA